eukprot:COSAG01_NODE_53197_length_341_cov_0.442149_1_plen_52_part_01
MSQIPLFFVRQWRAQLSGGVGWERGPLLDAPAGSEGWDSLGPLPCRFCAARA